MPHRWRLTLARLVRSEHLAWSFNLFCVALILFMAGLFRQALNEVWLAPSSERYSVAKAEAFEVPDHFVAHFAEHFVTNYEGFMPATCEAQAQYLPLIMSESMLARDPELMRKFQKYSRGSAIRSQVQIVPGTTEVIEHQDRWEVRLHVVKYEYTHGDLWRALYLECRVDVVVGAVGELSDHGLLIHDYEYTASRLDGATQ